MHALKIQQFDKNLIIHKDRIQFNLTFTKSVKQTNIVYYIIKLLYYVIKLCIISFSFVLLVFNLFHSIIWDTTV